MVVCCPPLNFLLSENPAFVMGFGQGGPEAGTQQQLDTALFPGESAPQSRDGSSGAAVRALPPSTAWGGDVSSQASCSGSRTL